MADPQVTINAGTDVVLDGGAVEEFKASLRGELLCSGDEGYDDARKVWNSIFDKRPAIIARCAGAADVISSVNFARANNLQIAVRSGGQSLAGHSVCEGGIMIDLSGMKSIRVDPVNHTARVEPGVTLGEFDRETQAFGLATTTGVISTTGIGGLTLGGGIGWLGRKHGLTCDNLLSVDIVTADGRLLTANATKNPDLFWAIRGGGGNFGVVTSFEYRLHSVGPIILGGMVVHPFEKAKEVLKLYRDYSITAPDDLCADAVLLTSPQGDPVVAVTLCYIGPIQEGDRVLHPLRKLGPPLADDIGPIAYTKLQSMLDDEFPPGLQYYSISNFMKDISDSAIDTITRYFATVPSPRSYVIFAQLGGAVSRVGTDETAYPHRDAQYDLIIGSAWSDPGESERHLRWTRDFSEEMQPFSTGGVYVNDLGNEGEERVKAAYGINYDRLVALKNKYDPTNLFHLNQNIKPTV